MDNFNFPLPADPKDSMSLEDAGKVISAASEKALSVQEASQRKLAALARAQDGADYRLSTKGQIAGFGVDSDFARSFTGGVVSGTGSMVDGVAALTGSQAVESAGDWFREGADNIKAARGTEFNNDVARATPTGDLFDPSTWDFGNGNLTGLVGLAAEVAGNLAPQLAGGVAGAAVKGATGAMLAGAASGGLQGAGGAAQDQWAFIDGLSDEQLSQNSELFNDLITTGKSPEEARATVREQAARMAGLAAGSVAAAGGAATQYILRGLPDMLTKVTQRPTLAAVATSAVEEATQEVGESVAAKAAANAAIGSDQNITEGSLTNLVLGAGAGAGMSGVGAAVSHTKKALKSVDKALKNAPTTALPEGANDSTSEAYDPISVMRDLETAASTGDKAAALKAADTLLVNHGYHIDDLTNKAKASNPVNREKVSQAIEGMNAQLEDTTLTDAERTAVETRRSNFETFLASGDGIDFDTVSEQLNTARTQLTEMENFHNSIQNSAIEPAATTAENSAPVTGDNNVIVRTMRNPGTYTAADLMKMADDTTSSLSEEQRGYLRSVSASQDSIDAVRSLDKTNAGVMTGTDGFKGLPAYRKAMAMAVNAGNTAAQARELGAIARFHKTKSSKAAALQEAYARYEQTGVYQQVVRKPDSKEWMVLDTQLDLPALQEQQGIEVSKNSQRLIDLAVAEASAIQAVMSEMQAMQKMKQAEVIQEASESIEAEPVETAPQERPEDAVPAEPTDDTAEAVEAASEPQEQPEQATERTDPVVPQPTEEATPEIEETLSEEPTLTVEATEATPEIASQPADLSMYGSVDADQGPTANLLHKHFTRSPGKTLNQVADLVSYVESAGVSALAAFTKSGVLTDTEVSALDSMLPTVKEWTARANGLIKLDHPSEFRHLNWASYLGTNGQLESNVGTAIALAAYEYAATNLSETLVNSDDDIRQILGKDSDAVLTVEERQVLRYAGNVRSNIVNTLGQAAYSYLGFKEADGDVPTNYRSNLITSLGIHALAVLQESQLVEVQQVPGRLFPDLRGKQEKGSISEHANVAFVRVRRNPDDTLYSDVQSIRTNYRNMPGTLTKVFGNEPMQVAPVFEKPDWKQSRIKNSDRGVPAAHQEAQAAYSQNAWRLRKDSTLTFFTGLSRELQERIVGVKPADKATTHINVRGRIEAKNAGLQRELDNLQMFIDMADREQAEEFYFPSVVWNVQRAGLRANLVNPQTSKIHRHVMSMRDWEATIRLDNSDGSLDALLLSAAVGLDVKVDKQRHTSSLKAVREKMSAAPYAEAIDYLTDYLTTGEITAAGNEAVVNAVESAGEAMHSYDALVALAQYKLAQRTGKSTFTTDMMMEVDGVTNGPMLTHLFLGIQNSGMPLEELAVKGGFYPENSEYTSFGEFKEGQGNNDLYETVAAELSRTIQGLGNDEPHQVQGVDAVLTIWGAIADDTGKATSAGRNMVKTPVTASGFGAGLNNVVSDMAGELLETLEKRIGNLRTQENPEGELKALVQSFNTLVSLGGGKSTDLLPANARIEWLMQQEWTPAQIDAFIVGYSATFGDLVTETMNSTFDGFMENRKLLNSAANMAYEMFDGVYTNARKQYANELLEKGQLAFRINKKGQKVPIADLSAKQEQALRKKLQNVFPAIHTYYSAMEGNLQNGISVYKSKMGNAAFGDATHSQEVQLAHSVFQGPNTKATKYVRATGRVMQMQSPGVGTLIKSIHSSDSAIASSVYGKNPVINLHDALGGAVTGIAGIARKMNKATLEVLTDYSVPLENVAALVRTVAGINELIQTDPTFRAAGMKHLDTVVKQGWKSTGIGKPLQSTLLAKHSGNSLAAYLEYVLRRATDMELKKLNALTNLGAINQYSYEGGHYSLTEADRNKLAERRNAVVAQAKDMYSQAMTAAQELAGLLGKPGGTTVSNAQIAYKSLGSPDAKELISRLRAAYNAAGDKALVKRLVRALVINGDVQAALTPLTDSEIESLKADLGMSVQKVTDNFLGSRRKRVKLLLESLVNDPANVYQDQTKALLKVINDRAKTFEEHLEAVEQDPTVRDLFTRYLERAHRAIQPTPWGAQGQSVAVADPALDQWLRSQKTINAKQAARWIYQHVSKGPMANTTMGNYYKQLLKRLGQLISEDTEVVYLTPQSGPVFDSYDYPQDSFAFMASKGGKQVIAIRGTDFKMSNVTTEAVIHEMLHSVMSNNLMALNLESALGGSDTASIKAVKRLKDVYSTIKQAMEADPALMSQFGTAIENMDEFLTWGMTNQAFQQYLATVEIKRQSGGLVSALRAFVDSLLTALGMSLSADNNSALAAIITDTAILLDEMSNDTDSVDPTMTVVRTMSAKNGPRHWSLEQVFDALAGSNDAHDNHLRSLLGTVVNKITAPAGTLLERARNNAAYNPRDLYLHSLINGELPFTSRAKTVIPMTEREAFTAELLELSVRESLDVSSLAYRELRRIFREARERIKPADFYDGDWAHAPNHEQERAQAIHDMLFKLEPSVEGAQDHLSRFAAMVAVYAPLRDKLDFVPGAVQKSDTLAARFEKWFLAALDVLTGHLLRYRSGSTANVRVQALVANLAQVEANQKMYLGFLQAADVTNVTDKANFAVKRLSQAVAEQGAKLSKSEYRPLRVLGNLADLAAKDRLGQLEDTFQHWRNQMTRKRQGILSALVTEVRGLKEANTVAYELHREANNNEKLAVQASEQTRRGLLESFEDQGASLTKEDKYAITSVILETDLEASLAEVSLDTWADILLDDKAIESEAGKMEQRLRQQLGMFGNYVISMAKDTAYHMATGVARNPHLAMNSATILSMTDTPAAGRIDERTQAEMQPLLDAYISTLAVRYTSMAKRKRVSPVLVRENARGDLSGVLTLVMLHAQYKRDSLEKLFDNNPLLMKKGYVKEIFNHHNDVVVSDLNDRDLLAMGYEQVSQAISDPDDSTGHKAIYRAKGAGLRRRETGIVALTGKRARGTKSNATMANDPVALAKMLDAKRAGIRQIFQRPATYNPDSSNDAFMVPLRDGAGKVMDYRYMMTTENRDRILERHNAFDDVMGGMSANLLNKQSSESTNRKAVQALRDMYQNPDAKAEDFIQFSMDSTDPEVRETYKLLPSAMKQAIREIWGSDEMYVPIDQYNMFFAYRRWSLAEILQKDPDAQKQWEAFLTSVFTKFMGPGAALKVLRAENMWMEAMTMIKDIVVIKNLFTLIGNVMSNVSVLLIHGINPVQMLRDHKVAIQGLYEYQRDAGQLYRLEARQKAGLGIPNGDVEQEIALLKDALARNPVRELAEAGLIQTIVEDVEADDDRFSYQTQFSNWVSEKTAKLPEGVVTAGKFMLMTHDTPLYKVFYRATSTSDFAARYALFQHLTKREKSPMSRRDALNRVEHEFVNYDIATHKGMDYMNRVGLMMFTKYYLRIQKIILTMFRERPAQALLSAIVGGFMDTLQTVMDSGFWQRMGNNPLTAGILQGPEALDEILPIKAALSLR